MPCLSASPFPGHLWARINGPSTKWLWEEIDTIYGNEDRHVLSPQLSWPLPLLSVQLSKPESNTEPLLGIVSWEHLPLRSILLDHSILEGAVMCLYGNNCISWRVTPLSYRWCFGQHHHMWSIGCLFTPMVSHTSSPLTEELRNPLFSHHLEAPGLMEWWNVILKAQGFFQFSFYFIL